MGTNIPWVEEEEGEEKIESEGEKDKLEIERGRKEVKNNMYAEVVKWKATGRKRLKKMKRGDWGEKGGRRK